MMPARHQGCYACLSPARCRCWRCNQPPPQTGSWRKWWSLAATAFVRRRPATGKPSRPPPDAHGPSGPPMTASSPVMAMPPWSTKGVRKASTIASSACCRRMPDGGVDLRARQPAAADAGDRPGAGGWRLPGCGVAIHYVNGDADPLFQTDKFAATQPTLPASWRR